MSIVASLKALGHNVNSESYSTRSKRGQEEGLDRNIKPTIIINIDGESISYDPKAAMDFVYSLIKKQHKFLDKVEIK